jgi:uncharacterized protein YjiK
MDSYNEFLLQAQAYNKDNHYNTFEEIIAANPKASSLHYKVGFSIGLYVKALEQKIPGLQDSLGRTGLIFQSYQFEIESSDIRDAATHVVSLTYTTDTMTLLGIVGDYLLLAPAELSGQALEAGVETFMIKMQEGLSVAYYREM